MSDCEVGGLLYIGFVLGGHISIGLKQWDRARQNNSGGDILGKEVSGATVERGGNVGMLKEEKRSQHG